MTSLASSSEREAQRDPGYEREEDVSTLVKYHVKTAHSAREEVKTFFKKWANLPTKSQEIETFLTNAGFMRDRVFARMQRLRKLALRLDTVSEAQLKSPLDSNPFEIIPWTEKKSLSDRNRIVQGTTASIEQGSSLKSRGLRWRLAVMSSRAKIAVCALEHYTEKRSTVLAIRMQHWKSRLLRNAEEKESIEEVVKALNLSRRNPKVYYRLLVPVAAGNVLCQRVPRQPQGPSEEGDGKISSSTHSTQGPRIKGVVVEIKNVCHIVVTLAGDVSNRVEYIQASTWEEGVEMAIRADPQRSIVSQSVSTICAAAKYQVEEAFKNSKDAPQAVLWFLLQWLEKYSTLFTERCGVCHRILGEDVDEADRVDFLPPTVRTLPFGRPLHPKCYRVDRKARP